MSDWFNKFQNLSISKQLNGIITVTLSMLPDDYPGESIRIGSTTLYLKSVSRPKGSILNTYMYSNIDKINESNIATNIIYRSVPKYIKDLDNYTFTSQIDLLPIDDPNTVYKIKVTESNYADDSSAWTAQDIIEDLASMFDKNVTVPSSIDYAIDYFVVSKGSNMVGIVRSLFQYPGLIIKNISEDEIVVDFPSDDLIIEAFERKNHYSCGAVSSNEGKEIKYEICGSGRKGKPLYVTFDGDNIIKFQDSFSNTEISYQYNLFGGVYAIKSQDTKITSFSGKTLLGKASLNYTGIVS